MKRSACLGVLCLVFALFAPAAPGAAPSKDEVNLGRETARLEKMAATPPGEAAVIKRIGKDFSVSADRVQELRGSGLGYGELAITLSLARRMPGGMTDANIGRVTALRQGPPVLGWGEIAKQLNVKLGVVVSQVRKISNEAHREMKTDHEARRPAPKAAEAPVMPREPRRTYSGEGRDMTRGEAAK